MVLEYRDGARSSIEGGQSKKKKLFINFPLLIKSVVAKPLKHCQKLKSVVAKTLVDTTNTMENLHCIKDLIGVSFEC